MKRIVALFLTALLCAVLPVGCARQNASPLPAAEYPLDFLFSSGAGAWGTRLALNANGSFEGLFSDSNMGETGKGYPYGTQYLCSFTGRFSAAQPLDAHSYSLTLETVTLDRPAGEKWIDGGILYISAGPYGLYNDTIDGSMSRSFVLYDPCTPVFGLDEELLSWWPGRFETTPPETLSCWALWNVEAGTAFFTDLQITH